MCPDHQGTQGVSSAWEPELFYRPKNSKGWTGALKASCPLLSLQREEGHRIKEPLFPCSPVSVRRTQTCCEPKGSFYKSFTFYKCLCWFWRHQCTMSEQKSLYSHSLSSERKENGREEYKFKRVFVVVLSSAAIWT